MKKIVYLLFACMAVFACKDEESGPGYTVPTVNEAPDFTDVDGKVYKCIEIGDQIWMAENLARRLPLGCRDGVFTYNEEVLDSVDYSNITVKTTSTEFKTSFWEAMEEAHANGKISDQDWNDVLAPLDRNSSYSTIMMKINLGATAECRTVVNNECYPAAMEKAKELLKQPIYDAAVLEGQEHFEAAE